MSLLSDVVSRVPPVRDAAANAVAERPRGEGAGEDGVAGCEARPREPGPGGVEEGNELGGVAELECPGKPDTVLTVPGGWLR